MVEKLDDQMDIYRFLSNSMAPQPAREYVVLRYAHIAVDIAFIPVNSPVFVPSILAGKT